MMKNKKSVTFVLGGLTGGGAERVASQLINYWAKNGRQVKLISRRGKEKDFFTISDSVQRVAIGGEGESSNVFIALLKNIWFVFHLRKAIKKMKTEVIISFLTKQNIYTILASVGLGKKIIISERNDTTRQEHKKPWVVLRRRLYKYADMVTANSDVALEGMREYVSSEKLWLIPNPVVIPRDPANPHQSKVLLNVGRLTEAKNQEFLIEAFSNVQINNHDWKLMIVGGGEKRETLSNVIESENIVKYVQLTGQVRDISECYQKAAIFVLTSKYEGTPNVLLEAMAHGLPSIVASNLPGALDLIQDKVHGFHYKGGNKKDLISKIKKLIEHPEQRKTMGETARESVQKYAIENVDAHWKKIIDEPLHI